MTDTNNDKKTFEIKDLKIGQTGKYNQFIGNSIDDGRRILFMSFDNKYCCVVTDTEWNTTKCGDFRKLKVTNLFISKKLHNQAIENLSQRNIVRMMKEKDNQIKKLQTQNIFLSGNLAVAQGRIEELQAEIKIQKEHIKRADEFMSKTMK